MQKLSLRRRLFGHFKTITTHKLLVTKLCFKCGLYKQGLLHDLSKYSFIEFSSGVKYYQGYRSPIDHEKEVLGYSLGWLHHKGRNKHHWEYWMDTPLNNKTYSPIEMPFNYLLESVLDRIAASKIYQKEKYHDDSAYLYFINSDAKYLMHEKTAEKTAALLMYLKENGEANALAYYKKLYLEYKNLNC